MTRLHFDPFSLPRLCSLSLRVSPSFISQALVLPTTLGPRGGLARWCRFLRCFVTLDVWLCGLRAVSLVHLPSSCRFRFFSFVVFTYPISSFSASTLHDRIFSIPGLQVAHASFCFIIWDKSYHSMPFAANWLHAFSQVG